MISGIFMRCKKYWKMFLLVGILLLVIYFCELYIPYIFSNSVDEIIQTQSMNNIWNSIVLVSIFTVLLIISSFLNHVFSEILIAKSGNRFLSEVDEKLERIPIRVTEKFSPAYLNHRIINDVLTSIGFLVNNYFVSIVMIISTIFLFFLVSQISFLLMIIPLAGLVLNITGVISLNKIFYKRGYKYRDANNQYIADNNELIAQIKETKTHSWFSISGKQVSHSFDNQLSAGISLNKVLAMLNNIGNLSRNVALILTMLLGGLLFTSQKISLGEYLLVTYYSNLCIKYSEFFLKLGQEYQHAKISFRRIEEFLSIPNEPNGEEVIDDVSEIVISSLSFRYDANDYVLNNVSYSFSKGKVYCIRGKNGEGKSTLVDLILGLDYAFEGIIRYNGIKIHDLDMISIRKNQISVVMQEPRLQRLTVIDNITRGIEGYPPHELKRYITRFGLENIFNNTDYNALSGGEKQKISLVRGFLKASSVFILDEPVSALDVDAIHSLKEEIQIRKPNSIFIIVSHNEILYDIVDEFLDLSSDLGN